MPLYNPVVSGGGGTEYGAAHPATGVANVYAMAPTNISSTITSGAIAALRLYMLPVWWNGGAATTIAFTIGTAAAAGKLLRYGLFNMKVNGTPGTLIQEVTASSPQAADTTGQITGTIAQTLAAGWYFLGIVSDGAPSIYGNSSASSALGLVINGTTVVNVSWLFRSMGTLVAFGDESSNTFSTNAAGTFAPLLGIK